MLAGMPEKLRRAYRDGRSGERIVAQALHVSAPRDHLLSPRSSGHDRGFEPAGEIGGGSVRPFQETFKPE
jgi:hypothetical protein